MKRNKSWKKFLLREFFLLVGIFIVASALSFSLSLQFFIKGQCHEIFDHFYEKRLYLNPLQYKQA